MLLEQPHTLGRPGAIDRVNRLLDRLIKEPPGGARIKEVLKRWDGERLTFRFGISLGFLGAEFSGTMDVTDDRAILELELPGLVKSFVPEERARQVIADHLGRALA